MPRYTLKIPHDIVTFIRHLPPTTKHRIRSCLDLILTTPLAGKILRAKLDGYRSYRAGRWRIVYRVGRRHLEIVMVGPRATIYPQVVERLRKLRKD